MLSCSGCRRGSCRWGLHLAFLTSTPARWSHIGATTQKSCQQPDSLLSNCACTVLSGGSRLSKNAGPSAAPQPLPFAACELHLWPPTPTPFNLQSLEKALSKHEIIGVRALAQRMKSGGAGGSSRGSSPSCGRSSGSSSPGVHRGSSNGASSPGAAGTRVLQGEQGVAIHWGRASGVRLHGWMQAHPAAAHCQAVWPPASPGRFHSQHSNMCASAAVAAAPQPHAEYKRSINETEGEARATAERLQQLQMEQLHLQQQHVDMAATWQQLQQQQEQLRRDTAAAVTAK